MNKVWISKTKAFELSLISIWSAMCIFAAPGSCSIIHLTHTIDLFHSNTNRKKINYKKRWIEISDVVKWIQFYAPPWLSRKVKNAVDVGRKDSLWFLYYLD